MPYKKLVNCRYSQEDIALTGKKMNDLKFSNQGDEPISYRGPLCHLPLSKRAAQLFLVIL